MPPKRKDKLSQSGRARVPAGARDRDTAAGGAAESVLPPAAWRNRIIGYGEEAPDQLLANDKNWRIHPKAQQDALAGVLREVGVVQNVLVNQRSGKMIDGHLRAMLAISAGQPTVPVTYVDLDEAEEAKILATIDPLAAMAGTDTELLKSLLAEVSTGDAALQALLDGMAMKLPGSNGVVGDADALLDQAGELCAKWKCEVGQVWRIGRHRLMIGDSSNPEHRDTLLSGESCDLICTDPPYEVDPETVAGTMALYAPRAVILCGSKQAFALAAIWKFRLDFIWRHRVPRMGMSVAAGHAPLLYHAHIVTLTQDDKTKSGWRRPNSTYGTVFDDEYEDKGGFGQGKPAALFAKMMEGFAGMKKIADPFAGTGASILACESSGRQCFAMEIEPTHAAVALQRCVDAGLSQPEIVSRASGSRSQRAGTAASRA